MASADHKKASRSSVIRAKAELPTNSTNAKKEATAKVIKKTMLKLCRNSSRLFLKNDTDTYPFVERDTRNPRKVTIVLNKLNVPYSAGTMYLAKMIRSRKPTPWLKKEKRENNPPLRRILLLRSGDIIAIKSKIRQFTCYHFIFHIPSWFSIHKITSFHKHTLYKPLRHYPTSLQSQTPNLPHWKVSHD